MLRRVFENVHGCLTLCKEPTIDLWEVPYIQNQAYGRAPHSHEIEIKIGEHRLVKTRSSLGGGKLHKAFIFRRWMAVPAV